MVGHWAIKGKKNMCLIRSGAQLKCLCDGIELQPDRGQEQMEEFVVSSWSNRPEEETM